MRILVVDDDETLRMTIRYTLEPAGHEIVEAKDGCEAVQAVERERFDAVFLDVNMPRMDGIQALEKIKEISPQSFCLILTAHSDVKDAVKAIKMGAYDYLEKPVEESQLFSLLQKADEAGHMMKLAAFSAPQVQFAEGRTMIGDSSEICKIFDIIYKLAKVDTSVLIRGESGTGKELVARALHFNSHRKKGPFVAVNCAALPENLIESEMFGFEKGAFTGADRRKIGKFQYAEGGTLFLDEIGDISQSMQVKLLRVLQEKVFSPVGSHQELKADVRVIAATNRPLEEMIQKQEFRSDLFYRLNVLPITLPSLRDRVDDILPLTEYMIAKFNEVHGRRVQKVEAGALQILRSYDWPGNIRELENVIEHAFIMESTDILRTEALPQGVVGQLQVAPGQKSAIKSPPLEHSELNYPALKERFERDFLVQALKAFEGRINRTAAHTKMTKVTLLRKLEKYAINPKEYRPVK